MAVSKDGPQYRFVIPDTRTTSRFRVRADARPGMTAWKFQSMIRKKPCPYLMRGGNRFSLGTNAKRLPGDHAPTLRLRRSHSVGSAKK